MTERADEADILEVSPNAIEKIAELIASRETKNLAVRVAIRGVLPGGGYQTEFKFMKRDEGTPEDIVQSYPSFDFLFSPEVAERVKGAKVDFDEDRYQAGFNIEYPEGDYLPEQAKPGKKWDDPIAQKVQTVIDDYINPGVAGHGGWVALLDVKEANVQVEMGGGCQGCGLAAVTLRQGVEQAILEAVPEVQSVIDMTAHEFGENPYYTDEQAEGMQDASPFAP